MNTHLNKPKAANKHNSSLFIQPSATQIAQKAKEGGENTTQSAEPSNTPYFGKAPLFNPMNTVQARLKMGQPNDKYEQEADRMADKVVSSPSAAPAAAPQVNDSSPTVQKMTEEEPEVQAKKFSETITPLVQRMETEDESSLQLMEDEELQAKTGSSGLDSTPNIENDLQASKGSGTSMDDNTRSEMESGFGRDFSDVNIHTGSNAVQMSEDIGAQAFTNGNDIYFNEGKYSPGTQGGKHLLAHELTHTVQQGGGGDTVQKQAKPAPKLVRHYNMKKQPGGGYKHNGVSKYDSVKLIIRSNNSYFRDSTTKKLSPLPKGNYGPQKHTTGVYTFWNSNGTIKKQIIHSTGGRNVLTKTLVATKMQSLIGQGATWVPSSKYSTNTFATWARTGPEHSVPPITSSSTINCWEMVMLSAYLAKAVSWNWINAFYDSHPGDAVGWDRTLPTRMTKGTLVDWNFATKTPKPKRGDLVFFDGSGHVAIATGSGENVYTFWPPPGKASVAMTYDKIKVEKITDLVIYMRNAWPSSPNKVTFAPPIW
ncbi:MAG: DUF4157 domain-containing protein [Crocinitomicaceae bacterium]|nr:DUF4157 domain-containing protein [Crocinitomicaceae bacterium]